MATDTTHGDRPVAGRAPAAASARARLPRLCAHLGYQFNEVALAGRFAAAAAAGFRGVEHPAPYELPAAAVRSALDAHGLRYVQLALPMGNRAAGDKGIACHPGREPEQQQGLRVAVEYATIVGAQWIHPMAGVVPAGVPRATALEHYVGNLRRASDAAAAAGLRVLVEFINPLDVPGYLIDSPQAALDAIARSGSDNIRVLVDSYHFAVVGIDAAAFVRAHAARVGHLQIADHPGRHEPGTGGIDFDALFATLDDVGYGGWVGCEYLPSGRTDAGLGWRDRFLPHDRRRMNGDSAWQ